MKLYNTETEQPRLLLKCSLNIEGAYEDGTFGFDIVLLTYGSLATTDHPALALSRP